MTPLDVTVHVSKSIFILHPKRYFPKRGEGNEDTPFFTFGHSVRRKHPENEILLKNKNSYRMYKQYGWVHTNNKAPLVVVVVVPFTHPSFRGRGLFFYDIDDADE